MREGLLSAFRLFLVLAFVLVSESALGSVTATVRHGEKEVPDADFCFYPVEPARPLSHIATESRCHRSDETVDVPSGTFRVYSRRVPDLVGAHHSLVFGSSEPRRGVLTLGLSAVAAARLELDPDAGVTDHGTHLSVIIGETPRNRPAVMPLDEDAPLIPAGVPVIPVLVRNGRPAAVGSKVSAAAGSVESIRFESLPGSTVLLTFEAEDPPKAGERRAAWDLPYSTDFLKELSQIEVPRVELTDSTGNEHHSQLQALDSSNLFESVYVFRGVPPGEGVIRVSGGYWKASETRVQIGEEAVTIPDPLLLEPAGVVQLTVDLPLMPERAADCGSAAEARLGDPRALLFDCGDVDISGQARSFLRGCTTVASREIDGKVRFPEVTFESLAPGGYVVATALGENVLNLRSVNVEAGATLVVEMELAELYVSGRVSRDDKPFASTVRFPTGSATTDPDTGAYVALLSSPPGQRPVYVVSCDESLVYIHRPSAEIATGSGYDLVVPSNEVVIEVVDVASASRVTDAMVMLALVNPEDPRGSLGGVPAISDGDRYRVRAIDPERTVVACAEKSGYKRSCSEPRTIRRELESLTVRLTPLGRRGRVDPPGGYSTIFWVDPLGEITERASIDAEGEFHFASDHTADYVILVGRAPLWVTKPEPPEPGGVLELNPPPPAERSVTFRVGGDDPERTATVLLWISGLPVPFPALVSHQQLRNRTWLIIDGAPLVVSGLFQGDQIAAAEGPNPDLLQGLPNWEAAAFAGRQPRPVTGPEVIFP